MSTSMKLDTLPQDVIHRFLVSLTDYQSLHSAILASKTFYKSFNNHPRGIIRSISENMHLRILPMALRLARAEIQFTATPIDPDQVEPEDSDFGQITTAEARLLSSNLQTTQALEIMFSRRRKDRSSRSNKLDPIESFRFKRGLYRVWLFCTLFGGKDGYNVPRDPDDDEDLEERLERLEEIRSKFFDAFTTQELFEIKNIYEFLLQVIKEAAARHRQMLAWHNYLGQPRWISYALSFGPLVLLDIYNDLHVPRTHTNLGLPIEDGFEDEGEDQDVPRRFSDFLDSTITLVFDKRKLTAPSNNSIITAVIGTDNSCERCSQTSDGFLLWNESNWDLLIDVFPLSDLPGYFPGCLARNRHDEHKFKQHFLEQEISHDDLFTQLFEAALPDATHPWSTQEWLCYQCIESFLRLHLMNWWRSEKKSGRVTGINPAMEDCWYGFECRTQVHKPEHAGKLNHACENTRRHVVVPQAISHAVDA